MKLYRFQFSTNVERVALALAYKGIEVESVAIDPADRSEVRRASDQDLVPVLVDGERVVSDSMEIVRYLEERQPSPPLYPTDPARRSEMLLFIDWFNRVWKRPPNEIEGEMGKENPDQDRITRLGRALTGYLDRFEELLSGRDHLLGSEFSAADCAAWPFVRYAALPPVEDDPWLFHRVLVQYQPLGDDHPRLKDWILRLAERPQA